MLALSSFGSSHPSLLHSTNGSLTLASSTVALRRHQQSVAMGGGRKDQPFYEFIPTPCLGWLLYLRIHLLDGFCLGGQIPCASSFCLVMWIFLFFQPGSGFLQWLVFWFLLSSLFDYKLPHQKITSSCIKIVCSIGINN